MKTYKVGFIGMGFFDPPPFRTEIAAACTSRRETAEKEAARLGRQVETC